MKTTKEFLIGLLASEVAGFVNVIKAMPEGKLDYKPDEKSRSAKELYSLLALESIQMNDIAEHGKIAFDFSSKPQFAQDEAVKMFEDNFHKLAERLAVMTEEQWDGKASMCDQNGVELWVSTKGEMLLSYLLDLIHHRGQLSTYIRVNGGKVPSIYGPSADSQ